VWILKYMRHPRLAVVTNTLHRSAGDLAHFAVLFAIIFGTYTVVANLFFGASLEGYHTFGKSVASCLLIILGDFDYAALVGVNPFGANLFFWTFIALCTLLLFNMIIGIVVAAYDAERNAGGQSSFFVDITSRAMYELPSHLNRTSTRGNDGAEPTVTPVCTSRRAEDSEISDPDSQNPFLDGSHRHQESYIHWYENRKRSKKKKKKKKKDAEMPLDDISYSSKSTSYLSESNSGCAPRDTACATIKL